jgi:hypothetical protein
MADLRVKIQDFLTEAEEVKNTGDAFEQAHHLSNMVELEQETHKTMLAIIASLRADLDMADLSEKLKNLKMNINAVENMVRADSSAGKRGFDGEEAFIKDSRRRTSY